MSTGETFRVGRTSLRVPRLGLGTAPIANLYRPIPESQALETIQYALEHGSNFFDTAPLYGAGLSEQQVGRALAGVARDRYVLATKVGRIIQPDGQVVFDFSRDGVMRSFESSLKRLGTDRIDILHIHDPDKHYREALDAAFPTLADLRSQGVIRAVGAGMNQWQMLADFASHADFDCFLLAGRYTLLEQGGIELLKVCQQKGIGIFLGGVFNSGILATGPKVGARYNYTDPPAPIVERVQRLQDACQQEGVLLRDAAMHFALSHPAVTALVVGAESPAEVAENQASLVRSIPSALWTTLQATGLLDSDVPLPPS